MGRTIWRRLFLVSMRFTMHTDPWAAHALSGALLITMAAGPAWGLPVDMDKLPNQGRNSFGCVVCHISPAGEEINVFGRDYRDNDHQYDERLKRMDSDGDGYSNDVELRANPPTNPGDPRSYPRNPPHPWAWGATTLAVAVILVGGFTYAVRRSCHSS
jgi:hypothetical protein